MQWQTSHSVISPVTFLSLVFGLGSDGGLGNDALTNMQIHMGYLW